MFTLSYNQKNYLYFFYLDRRTKFWQIFQSSRLFKWLSNDWNDI